MPKIDFIEDFKTATHLKASPTRMDNLWGDGWRNFGEHFFRNRVDYLEQHHKWVQVVPLRINLEKFSFSKHQKKLLQKQKNTQVICQMIALDDVRHEMFAKHIMRFKSNIPDSLYTFLGNRPGIVPCQALECALYDEAGKLYAASYFGVGKESISSIYATFDTDYDARSPGLHTLLEEIKYAQNYQKKYVYLGYCYREPSFYDYKKNFYGLESYDWEGNWLDFERVALH